MDGYLKGLAALVCAAFAVVVLAMRPRGAPNRFLGFFLLLLAGNQGAEAVRALVASPEESLRWFRVATVFAALDPVALYYFASIYPRRNALNRTLPLALVMGCGAAFALTAAWMVPAESEEVLPAVANLGLAAFTAAAYSVALAVVVRAHLREPQVPGLRWLVPALAVAALPVWSRSVGLLVRAANNADLLAGADHATYLLLSVALQATALAAGARLLWRAGRGGADGGPLRLGAAVGLVAGRVLMAPPAWNVAQLHGLVGPWRFQALMAQAGPSVRLLAFGGLVSVAVVRHRLLDASLASRRRAARVLLGIFFLFAASMVLLVVATLAGATVMLGPAEWTLLVAVLVASQGFRGLVDQAAWRVYGVPLPGDVTARQEAYRQAAVHVASEGRLGAGDADLARLRDELGIGPEVARAMERVAEASSRAPLEPGQLVAGRYRVERLLGKGGGGRAFLARDELLERDLVLKEILLDGDASEEGALREARAAGAVQHPHVVTVHDVLQRRRACVLVTEHLRGGSLEERVDAQGPYATEEGLDALERILDGLSAVHRKGIVHRDLKPSNVLLDAQGSPKIADFGLARMRRGPTRALSALEARQGTPGFMAPEQRRGGEVQPSTDVYAAGLLARACVQGPFPPAVEEVIVRALAEAPQERWRDAEAMLAALREARGARALRRAPQAQ